MPSELPQPVCDAIHARRKIEAIKLLREHHDIGLKEAKDLVDEYMATHSHLMNSHPKGDGRVGSVLIIISLAAFVIYVAYRVFS